MTVPCAIGDPDRWFPPSGLDPKQVAALKAECATCPIIDSCREWAVVHAEHGIWGATTDGERAKIRRHRGITPQRIATTVFDDARNAKVRSMVVRGSSPQAVAAALGITLSAADQAMAKIRREIAAASKTPTEPRPRRPRRKPEPSELVYCQQCRSYRGQVVVFEGDWVRAVRKATRRDNAANREAAEKARVELDRARRNLAEHESWCPDRNVS